MHPTEKDYAVVLVWSSICPLPQSAYLCSTLDQPQTEMALDRNVKENVLFNSVLSFPFEVFFFNMQKRWWLCVTDDLCHGFAFYLIKH